MNDWQHYDPMDPYEPDWIEEFVERRGVLVDTTNFEPLQYFSLYFPEEAFQLIVDQTNDYAMQFFDNTQDISPRSRFRQMKPTSVMEMKVFVALQYAMGLCQKHCLEDYWGAYWLTHTPFTKVMSRDRFEMISSFIHFANNEEERPARGQDGYDPLWKMRPLMDICEPLLLSNYGPRCELAIDESIIKFKGRLSFKQFLPSKPTKWGIKQFCLAESKTGYALKFMTYTGKNSVEVEEGFGVTESVCLKLLSGFTNKGHHIYTDNFYTSPNLFSKLATEGTGACGTVKAGRKNMPPDIHPRFLALDRGDDPKFMRKGNLVACAWQDTKRVHFLSTIHTNNTIDKRIRSRGGEGGYRTVEKPVIGELYNQHMGAVDICDQKLGTYTFPHKSGKWYMTIYHRIREVAMVNAYILYCADKGDQAMSCRKFRESVIDALLEGYSNPSTHTSRIIQDIPTRITERHFIGFYNDAKKSYQCVVCSDRVRNGWKRKETRYYCKQCDKSMCPAPCHEIYHTQKDYKKAAARIVYGIV